MKLRIYFCLLGRLTDVNERIVLFSFRLCNVNKLSLPCVACKIRKSKIYRDLSSACGFSWSQNFPLESIFITSCNSMALIFVPSFLKCQGIVFFFFDIINIFRQLCRSGSVRCILGHGLMGAIVFLLDLLWACDFFIGSLVRGNVVFGKLLSAVVIQALPSVRTVMVNWWWRISYKFRRVVYCMFKYITRVLCTIIDVTLNK